MTQSFKYSLKSNLKPDTNHLTRLKIHNLMAQCSLQIVMAISYPLLNSSAFNNKSDIHYETNHSNFSEALHVEFVMHLSL